MARPQPMPNLTDFLLARIAEDEEVVGHALEAIDGDRTAYAAELARKTGPYSTVTSSSHCGQDMGPRGTVEATPGRVLAECEAKRRIVELHRLGGSYTPGDDRAEGFDYCANCGSGEPYEYPTEWPCETLCALALPYADHPDYQGEWRP